MGVLSNLNQANTNLGAIAARKAAHTLREQAEADERRHAELVRTLSEGGAAASADAIRMVVDQNQRILESLNAVVLGLAEIAAVLEKGQQEAFRWHQHADALLRSRPGQ